MAIAFEPKLLAEGLSEWGGEKPKYHLVECDDYISIHTYPHTMTFGQFRVNAFNHIWGREFRTQQDMQDCYMRTRNELKGINRALHGKKHKMSAMLNECCNWKSLPPKYATMRLLQVRWLSYDGNSRVFVADNGTNYVLVRWGGS